MSEPIFSRKVSRRQLLKIGGLAVAASAGATLVPRWAGKSLPAIPAAKAAGGTSPAPTIYRHLIGSDGWISIPMGTIKNDLNAVVAPDPLAPTGRSTYVFGFRNVTALDDADTSLPLAPGSSTNRITPGTASNPKILAQRGHVQHSAPLLFFDQNDAIQITLSNLGLAVRPDLTDPHTIHWHGFRNALPLFDGVPEMSISVPPGSDFPYYYHPTDPGTYMYHCHNEDVEHVQMGMDGILFVRPAQNKTGNGAGAPVARYNGGPANAPLGYAYNDGVALNDPRSTAYNREFAIFLNEFWAQSHYDDAHIQVSDWSDFHADFYLMNGRSYPDTLAPNGGGTDLSTGNLIAPAGRPDLESQPLSSLIQCNAGDKVLLRFVNLGYTQPAMKLSGIEMHVIGKDATPLRGIGTGGLRNGADTSRWTDTIYLGAGEAYDAIFTAPPKTGSGYDTYLLFSNAFGTLNRPGSTGLGGQMTEVRVYAAGTLPPQTAPNT